MQDRFDLRATKNNVLAARRTMRAATVGSLATLIAPKTAEDAAVPYASLVTAATDQAGAPLLLISRLADHTANIADDARVSLLLAATDGYGNPQEAPRVSVVGRAERVADDARARLVRRFLARHPGAALYADFPDFAVYRIAPDRLHFVGGFGRAIWLDADQVLLPMGTAEALAEAAPALVATVEATAAQTLAHDLAGERSGGWRAAAIDVDGLDISNDHKAIRMCFDTPLEGPGGFAAAFDGLLERAHAARLSRT